MTLRPGVIAAAFAAGLALGGFAGYLLGMDDLWIREGEHRGPCE